MTPDLMERLSVGTAGTPGAAAALWMLTTHGYWTTRQPGQERSGLETCLKRRADGSLSIRWTKLARMAAWATTASDRDVAVALAACQVAGYYDPAGPPLEPINTYSRTGVFERDNWTCVYCGGVGDTIDHVWPRARGGKNGWDNCVAACQPCNVTKGCKSLTELGWTIPGRHVEAVKVGRWGTHRISRALGPEGRTLRAAATYRRDALAERLAALTEAVADAALAVLGVADGSGVDPFDQAILASAMRRLAERRGAASSPATAVADDQPPVRHLVAV